MKRKKYSYTMKGQTKCEKEKDQKGKKRERKSVRGGDNKKDCEHHWKQKIVREKDSVCLCIVCVCMCVRERERRGSTLWVTNGYALYHKPDIPIKKFRSIVEWRKKI